MSTFDYGFGTASPAEDQQIQKQYPGITYTGTEANAIYVEQREVNGVFWTATNATWNASLQGWQQVNASLSSFAQAVGPSGFQFYQAPAGAATPISWVAVSFPTGSLAYTNVANTFTQPQTIQGSLTLTSGSLSVSAGNVSASGTMSAGGLSTAEAFETTVNFQNTTMASLMAGGTSGALIGWNGINGGGEATIVTGFNGTTAASFWCWNGSTYVQAANISSAGTYTPNGTGSSYGTNAVVNGTITAAKGVMGSALSNATTTQAHIPPAYTTSGTDLGTTSHTATGNVTANAATTTVNFLGAAEFINTNYFLAVIDVTAGTLAVVTAQTIASFTFNSTSGHVYTYFAHGA